MPQPLCIVQAAPAAGVDPLAWTSRGLRRRCRRCRSSGCLTRLRFGGRWWSRFDQANARGPVARVRAHGAVDPELGPPSGAGRRRPQGWRREQRRAVGPDKAPARDPPPAPGAQHLGKGGSLVRKEEDPELVFRWPTRMAPPWSSRSSPGRSAEVCVRLHRGAPRSDQAPPFFPGRPAIPPVAAVRRSPPACATSSARSPELPARPPTWVPDGPLLGHELRSFERGVP